MAHEPTDADVRAFAATHRLSEDQARQLLTEHGDDEDRLAEGLRSLKHFLKAPS
jgi:hypothetical protein